MGWNQADLDFVLSEIKYGVAKEMTQYGGGRKEGFLFLIGLFEETRLHPPNWKGGAGKMEEVPATEKTEKRLRRRTGRNGM